MPLISNCSMMPAWHQLVSMSGHVEESETARKLQLYATSIYQVHSFVCQLDYLGLAKIEIRQKRCTYVLCLVSNYEFLLVSDTPWFGFGFINCLDADLLLCPIHKKDHLRDVLGFSQTGNPGFSFIMYHSCIVIYWRRIIRIYMSRWYQRNLMLLISVSY